MIDPANMLAEKVRASLDNLEAKLKLVQDELARMIDAKDNGKASRVVVVVADGKVVEIHSDSAGLSADVLDLNRLDAGLGDRAEREYSLGLKAEILTLHPVF